MEGTNGGTKSVTQKIPYKGIEVVLGFFCVGLLLKQVFVGVGTVILKATLTILVRELGRLSIMRNCGFLDPVWREVGKVMKVGAATWGGVPP